MRALDLVFNIMRYDTCCVADFYYYNKYPNHSSDIGQHDAKIINISGKNQ